MKQKQKYDYYTLQRNVRHGWVTCYGWTTYPKSSVLAGQEQKVFLEHCDTEEEAQKLYPDANWSCPLMERTISLNHLSDDGDY